MAEAERNPLKCVVVAGGTGLIGRHLVQKLLERGVGVKVLTRRPGAAALPAGAEAVGWDEVSKALEGADGVVNLAGEGIADRRWSPARKQAILTSRVQPTVQLAKALAGARRRPVLVNASAVGWYGPRGGEPIDEAAGPGTGFLAQVCREWERAADGAAASGVRVVKLRFGAVLARDGGALPKMALPVKLFLGAKLGHGQQGLSWIHVDDLVALILEALENPAWDGAFNATAPGPVTNQTFTEALGRTLHRPVFPVPGFLTRAGVKLLVGEMAEEMLLAGVFAYPRRAEALGFEFRFPRVDAALQDLLA